MKPSLILAALILASTSALAATKPVPASCTPEVNATLLQFLHDNRGDSHAQLDNVMVCGTAIADSFEQRASSTGTGAHQVILLSVPTSDGSKVTVEIVSNDSLDGVVSASKGDTVYAYGQGYITSSRDIRKLIHPVAGVHDTHCATNSHMDDGWVVVNGTRYPAQACKTSGKSRRKRRSHN